MTALLDKPIAPDTAPAPAGLATFLSTFGIRRAFSYDGAGEGGAAPISRPVRDALRRRVDAVAESPTARRQRSLYAYAAAQGVISHVHSIKADAIRASGEAVTDALANLPAGTRVLDLGCSTGHLSLWYAHRFPHFQVVGCDFVPEAIDQASEAAAARGITNARFEVADLAVGLPEGPFDAVISTQGITSVDGDRAAVVAHAATALRQGGQLIGVEILPNASKATAFIDGAASVGLALVGATMAPFEDGFVPGAYPVLTFVKGTEPIEVDIAGLYEATLVELRRRHFRALGWTDEEIEENRVMRAARGECDECGGCGA
jgi:SAM-dependent methyltransferase